MADAFLCDKCDHFDTAIDDKGKKKKVELCKICYEAILLKADAYDRALAGTGKGKGKKAAVAVAEVKNEDEIDESADEVEVEVKKPKKPKKRSKKGKSLWNKIMDKIF